MLNDSRFDLGHPSRHHPITVRSGEMEYSNCTIALQRARHSDGRPCIAVLVQLHAAFLPLVIAKQTVRSIRMQTAVHMFCTERSKRGSDYPGMLNVYPELMCRLPRCPYCFSHSNPSNQVEAPWGTAACFNSRPSRDTCRVPQRR
jgi:hypothetical protein